MNGLGDIYRHKPRTRAMTKDPLGGARGSICRGKTFKNCRDIFENFENCEFTVYHQYNGHVRDTHA